MLAHLHIVVCEQVVEHVAVSHEFVKVLRREHVETFITPRAVVAEDTPQFLRQLCDSE